MLEAGARSGPRSLIFGELLQDFGRFGLLLRGLGGVLDLHAGAADLLGVVALKRCHWCDFKDFWICILNEVELSELQLPLAFAVGLFFFGEAEGLAEVHAAEEQDATYAVALNVKYRINGSTKTILEIDCWDAVEVPAIVVFIIIEWNAGDFEVLPGRLGEIEETDHGRPFVQGLVDLDVLSLQVEGLRVEPNDADVVVVYFESIMVNQIPRHDIGSFHLLDAYLLQHICALVHIRVVGSDLLPVARLQVIAPHAVMLWNRSRVNQLILIGSAQNDHCILSHQHCLVSLSSNWFVVAPELLGLELQDGGVERLHRCEHLVFLVKATIHEQPVLECTETVIDPVVQREVRVLLLVFLASLVASAVIVEELRNEELALLEVHDSHRRLDARLRNALVLWRNVVEHVEAPVDCPGSAVHRSECVRLRVLDDLLIGFFFGPIHEFEPILALVIVVEYLRWPVPVVLLAAIVLVEVGLEQ